MFILLGSSASDMILGKVSPAGLSTPRLAYSFLLLLYIVDLHAQQSSVSLYSTNENYLNQSWS